MAAYTSPRERTLMVPQDVFISRDRRQLRLAVMMMKLKYRARDIYILLGPQLRELACRWQKIILRCLAVFCHSSSVLFTILFLFWYHSTLFSFLQKFHRNRLCGLSSKDCVILDGCNTAAIYPYQTR